jgi:O-antigen/teichoic acid export membrane protein
MQPAQHHLAETAQKFLSSAGAATVSQIWRMAVTLGTHILLRRLIPPEELGLWNWVDPLFLVLAQVRDLGVNGQVVRDKRRPFGSFLGLELFWGGLFTVMVLVSAPWLGDLYRDHSVPVVTVIQAMCVFLFVHGLGMVPTIFFEVELQVRRTVRAEIIRNTLFALIALSLAIMGYGVWSAVIAHVAAATVYTVMIWFEAWGEIHFHRVDKLGALIRLSLPLMMLSLLELMVLRVDYFVLGYRFETAVVGFAGLAWQAVFFFSRMIADSVGRSLYPALVRYADEPRRAFEAYRVATVFMMSLSVPLAFFLFNNAELMVALLGGRGWEGAAGYLRWLSLVPLVRPLTMFGIELLLTLHLDAWQLACTTLNLLAVGGIGLWLTATGFGPLGMALAGYFPLGVLPLLWVLHKLAKGQLFGFFRQLLELEVVGAALFLPLYFLIPDHWLLWRFASSCLAGVAYLAYAWRRNDAMFGRFVRGDL